MFSRTSFFSVYNSKKYIRISRITCSLFATHISYIFILWSLKCKILAKLFSLSTLFLLAISAKCIECKIAFTEAHAAKSLKYRQYNDPSDIAFAFHSEY